MGHSAWRVDDEQLSAGEAMEAHPLLPPLVVDLARSKGMKVEDYDRDNAAKLVIGCSPWCGSDGSGPRVGVRAADPIIGLVR